MRRHYYIAHSDSEKAVQRTAALDTRAAMAIVAIMLFAFAIFMWGLRGTPNAISEYRMTVITVVLGSAAFIATCVACAARYGINTFLKSGAVLRVDESTVRDFRKLVKVSHTHWSNDALFNRQRALNLAAQAWDDAYLEQYGRTRSTKV